MEWSNAHVECLIARNYSALVSRTSCSYRTSVMGLRKRVCKLVTVWAMMFVWR